ncbi:MAG: hypothetical protein JXA13_15310 [Anaerolineales bacterium]|nr:hypothetical protein [Anaerolineales bacterium]
MKLNHDASDTASPKAWKVAGKGILLFLLFNALFALWNPAIDRLTIYNTLLPGRERLTYAYTRVYTLDALFAPHIISSQTKQADEYRIVLIGDSSTYGTNLKSEETVAARLQNAAPPLCNNKHIRAYNLGYHQALVSKDLLILSKSLQYQPDLIIWMTTLAGVTYHPDRLEHPVLKNNLQELQQLNDQYGFTIPGFIEHYSPPTLFDRTLIGKRKMFSNLAVQQLDWIAADTQKAPDPENFPPIVNNLEDNLGYEGMSPPKLDPDKLGLEAFSVGSALSGEIPILFVNEPIFIADGANSEIRYNEWYPRWAYDQYREILRQKSKAEGWYYLDLWNLLPGTGFTDSIFHRTPDGEQIVSDHLFPVILEIACGSNR